MATLNYLLDATYESATLNPENILPVRELRLLYQSNRVRPIEVAQILCGAHCSHCP